MLGPSSRRAPRRGAGVSTITSCTPKPVCAAVRRRGVELVGRRPRRRRRRAPGNVFSNTRTVHVPLPGKAGLVPGRRRHVLVPRAERAVGGVGRLVRRATRSPSADRRAPAPAPSRPRSPGPAGSPTRSHAPPVRLDVACPPMCATLATQGYDTRPTRPRTPCRARSPSSTSCPTCAQRLARAKVLYTDLDGTLLGRGACLLKDGDGRPSLDAASAVLDAQPRRAPGRHLLRPQRQAAHGGHAPARLATTSSPSSATVRSYDRGARKVYDTGDWPDGAAGAGRDAVRGDRRGSARSTRCRSAFPGQHRVPRPVAPRPRGDARAAGQRRRSSQAQAVLDGLPLPVDPRRQRHHPPAAAHARRRATRSTPTTSCRRASRKPHAIAADLDRARARRRDAGDRHRRLGGRRRHGRRRSASWWSCATAWTTPCSSRTRASARRTSPRPASSFGSRMARARRGVAGARAPAEPRAPTRPPRAGVALPRRRPYNRPCSPGASAPAR